ncbi:MAG: CoxG family protein [Halobacteriales archaeon]
MLEFTGEQRLERPPEELWPYFTDPDVLAECAPGCRSMELVEPHELAVTLAVGVGSVKPEFEVDVLVTEATFPSVLSMRAIGHAPRNEFEMTADMVLEPTDDGGTNVTWTATADVSGTIASLGGRALKSVTKRLVNRFFDDLEAVAADGEVEAVSRLETAPPEATLGGGDDAEA